MLQIETSGTPIERGHQQGRQCRELAVPWIERVLALLATRVGASSSADVVHRMRDRVARCRRWTEAVYPEAVGELRGIACGLGLDEDTYFTAIDGRRALDFPAQCTTLGFRDAHGAPLVGKTDDIYQHELGMNVLEITRPHEGHAHVQFHFAGTIWTAAGMNARGLAIAMTGIPGPSLAQDGMSDMVAIHAILPVCAMVAEAVDHIRAQRVNHYGFSLLVGDADGGLTLVEKTGAGTVVLDEQSGGFLVHTNHILDPAFATRNPAQREPFLTNGRRRYENALTQVGTLPRTKAGMRRFLAVRSPSGPICQQGEDGVHTDFAVMFLPTERRMVFWPGYPVGVSARTMDVGAVLG